MGNGCDWYYDVLLVCIAFPNERFLVCVFSWIVLSSLLCSTHADACEMASDTAFSHCRAMLLTGLLMFPTTLKTVASGAI